MKVKITKRKEIKSGLYLSGNGKLRVVEDVHEVPTAHGKVTTGHILDLSSDRK